LGEVEQSIELTRQALATEPLRANWYNWLAGYFSGLNRLDEAERAIRTAIELQPGAVGYHYTLAIIEIQRGNAPAALAAAQQEPAGVWQDNALALARQIGGDRSAARCGTQDADRQGRRPIRLPDGASLRCAMIRKKPLRGSIGLGATAMEGSPTSSTTPSSCTTRTTRDSPRSARRWACRRLQRLESGRESVGSPTL